MISAGAAKEASESYKKKRVDTMMVKVSEMIQTAADGGATELPIGVSVGKPFSEEELLWAREYMEELGYSIDVGDEVITIGW